METAPVLEAAEAAAALPEPSIHEQAYWDNELTQLSDEFEPFRHVPLNEMDKEQTADFLAFMWRAVLRNRQLLEQLALEPPVVAEQPVPKPARKARAPKVKPTETPADDVQPEEAA